MTISDNIAYSKKDATADEIAVTGNAHNSITGHHELERIGTGASLETTMLNYDVLSQQTATAWPSFRISLVWTLPVCVFVRL